MRERINRLAKGIVDYDDIQVAFSVTRIEEPIAFDDRVRNEFRIVCENGKTVKGLVYSTNQRVSLLTDNFMGRDCRILYEVDASYAEGEHQRRVPDRVKRRRIQDSLLLSHMRGKSGRIPGQYAAGIRGVCRTGA